MEENAKLKKAIGIALAFFAWVMITTFIAIGIFQLTTGVLGWNAFAVSFPVFILWLIILVGPPVMIASYMDSSSKKDDDEEELATLNAVIEYLPDFVRIYCGRIGSHPAHIWATQDDKQVSCVGIDPYAVLNRIQDKHKENSDEPTGT